VADATIGGTSDALVVDAPVGVADAPTAVVDATVGGADASANADAMISPDAAAGTPDASGTPDAAGTPDASIADASFPDASVADAAPPVDAPPGTTCTLQTPSFSQLTAVAIPDSTTVTSTISVTGADPYLWGVTVQTNITHSYSGDLEIVLISPTGTRITMARRVAGTADDVFNGTVWDDAAPTPVVDYSFSTGVTATPVVPEGAFAALAGEDANGVWTLEVTDAAGSDTGSIASWSLTLTAGVTPTPASGTHNSTGAVAIPDDSSTTSSIVVAGAGSVICDVNLTTNITHTYSGDLDIALVSPGGTRTVLVTENNAGTAADVFNGSLWDDATGTLMADVSFSDGVTASPLLAEGAMGAFTGENPNGSWTLEVADTASIDTGSIDAWSLIITTCDCP